MLETALITLVANFVAGQLKRFVPDQYRSSVVHGAIFLGVIAYVAYSHPELRSAGDLVHAGILILGFSVGLYEVVLKRITTLVPAFGKVF